VGDAFWSGYFLGCSLGKNKSPKNLLVDFGDCGVLRSDFGENCFYVKDFRHFLFAQKESGRKKKGRPNLFSDKFSIFSLKFLSPAKAGRDAEFLRLKILICN
jgi:hypothetical protein